MNLKTYTPLPNRSPLPVLYDILLEWMAWARKRAALHRDLRRRRSEYISMMNMPDHLLYDIGISRDQIKEAYLDTFRSL